MKAVTKDQCRTKGWKNGRVNPFLNLIKKINQACSLSFELNFAILFFEPNETNLLQKTITLQIFDEVKTDEIKWFSRNWNYKIFQKRKAKN